jgi:hypothetical protein
MMQQHADMADMQKTMRLVRNDKNLRATSAVLFFCAYVLVIVVMCTPYYQVSLHCNDQCLMISRRRQQLWCLAD